MYASLQKRLTGTWSISDVSGMLIPHYFMVVAKHCSSKKLIHGLDILITADLSNEKQYVTCYVVCDEIGAYEH